MPLLATLVGLGSGELIILIPGLLWLIGNLISSYGKPIFGRPY